MKKKVVPLAAGFVIVVAIAALVGWLFSPEAGAATITILAVAIGVYVGADWGGDSATKTEEYRQTLIGKPAPRTTYYYDDGSSSDDPTEGSDAARDANR